MHSQNANQNALRVYISGLRMQSLRCRARVAVFALSSERKSRKRKSRKPDKKLTGAEVDSDWRSYANIKSREYKKGENLLYTLVWDRNRAERKETDGREKSEGE